MTIPVTVIGGFLGSGKTTLLNRILMRSSARTAVLVNDFGEINVDAALVESADDLTFQLSGGCICCSMADGIGPAIERALAADPANLVIEASGVGEPRRVAEFALLRSGLHLDLVVALAHAADLARQLDDPLVGDIVARQFDGTDLIVLNHADRASPEALAQARSVLRRLAPGRAVAQTSFADVPDDLLTGFPPSAIRPEPGHDHDRHEDIFARYAFSDGAPFDRRTLGAALDALPPSVLRLKGWVRLAGEDGLWLVQFSGGRWTLSPSDDPACKAGLVAIATEHGLSLSHLLRGSPKK